MDYNLHSYYAETGTRIHSLELPAPPANPGAYDDIVKLSNCINTTVDNCSISGGREDCIDACRGEGLRVQDCELYPKGRNGITIKGAFKTWIVSQCYFKAHGSECDIELGQFSMYDRFPFRKDRTQFGCITACTSVGNTPIIVRVWNADAPSVIQTNVKIVKIPWVVWFSYFCFRRVQMILTRR